MRPDVPREGSEATAVALVALLGVLLFVGTVGGGVGGDVAGAAGSGAASVHQETGRNALLGWGLFLAWVVTPLGMMASTLFAASRWS